MWLYIVLASLGSFSYELKKKLSLIALFSI